eukprot:4276680-Pleurochrysis_carterae.AAC.1
MVASLTGFINLSVSGGARMHTAWSLRAPDTFRALRLVAPSAATGCNLSKHPAAEDHKLRSETITA